MPTTKYTESTKNFTMKFHFVPFVLFVVIFLSRFILLSPCENVDCRISAFFTVAPAASVVFDRVSLAIMIEKQLNN